MLGTRKENAWLQSNFYRDQFRKILHWLVICVLIIFIQLAAIIYLILFQPSQQYYANTTEGIILAMPQPKIT